MILENNWRNKSIEALEKTNHGDTDTAPTGLVKHCFEYVKIPVNNLSVEQLRTLISQNIGLNYTIRLAFEILNENILAEGDLYEGDLLNSVINIDTHFWLQNKVLKDELAGIIERHKTLLNEHQIRFESFLN
ncbi:contact-dependent growth inhibition system immunity protein [Mucilaginibacter yixingensis]|nr:contact-dependent growth inhibition system immunity protein [Mucilaginibacter yixingensis]